MSTKSPDKGFARGKLREIASDTTYRALHCGALQPISTTAQWVNDGGVDFLVRVLSDRNRADEPKPADRVVYPKSNPFLPCDPDLFVAGLSPTHLCLLNKFTVLADHLLIVTREFEHQETWLSRQDFRALWTCMAEYDGLGFYNGGISAGASQPHKHLQYVPFPMATMGPDVPIEALLLDGHFSSASTATWTFTALPFAHAFVRLDFDACGNGARQVDDVFDAYISMLTSVGIDASGVEKGGRQTGAYNLLVTRRWMLLVPRSQAGLNGISVNALGFAGHLLARNRHQVDIIRDLGPLSLLRQVGWG
jgi:ATP adenylyltransferase